MKHWTQIYAYDIFKTAYKYINTKNEDEMLHEIQ